MSEVSISRQGARIIVDLDFVAALALGGLLTEADRESPALGCAGMLEAVDRALFGPVALSEPDTVRWMRALMAVRAQLTVTLAAVDLPRDEVDVHIGHLAAGSPVESAARAFWWTGVLLKGLASAYLR